MEFAIKTLDGKDAGKIKVSEAVFGLEPRTDILHRMVRWQLAKRQQGTHDVKNRSEINRTTKKMYKQKGTGGARHGAMSAPQFRGGGRAFGPTPRSHAHDLPKQVRALALRHALSAKAKDSAIVVIDDFAAMEPKTKALQAKFAKLGLATRSSSAARRSTRTSALPPATCRTSTCCRCRASTSMISFAARSSC